MMPEDRQQVLLLCFSETIIRLLMTQAKKNTRRYNKLQAALQNIVQADETFPGHLTDADHDRVLKLFNELELRVHEVLKEQIT